MQGICIVGIHKANEKEEKKIEPFWVFFIHWLWQWILLFAACRFHLRLERERKDGEKRMKKTPNMRKRILTNKQWEEWNALTPAHTALAYELRAQTSATKTQCFYKEERERGKEMIKTHENEEICELWMCTNTKQRASKVMENAFLVVKWSERMEWKTTKWNKTKTFMHLSVRSVLSEKRAKMVQNHFCSFHTKNSLVVIERTPSGASSSYYY